MNPLILVDYYKTEHQKMYPEGMTKLYSNFTPRKSRIKGVEHVVNFGLQHFILEYLIKKFNKDFFVFTKEEREHLINGENRSISNGLMKTLGRHRKRILSDYAKHIKLNSYSHIEKLWDLGYLPIEIKSLPEGTLVPIGVPVFTITNTHPDFAWLVNYLETLISAMMWQPITSATIANEYKKILKSWAIKTTGSSEGVEWQGHDFSMRGMSSVETATISGMAHLLSFTGTDTIPAIYALESSYSPQKDTIIGGSVPATEHSVMCMGEKETEIETFKRLLKLYPTGILSVVSDTWDLWKVLTEYLPQIKDEILSRDGKLVIRPDSGNPIDIICGVKAEIYNDKYFTKSNITDDNGEALLNHLHITNNEYKGVIELLWDVFGGTTNEQGYKVLDSHIGAIYGDGIGLHNVEEIMSRLEAKGFASTNIVLGFGSYGYQYNTRDTFGFAMKATYGEITHEGNCGYEDPEEMCCDYHDNGCSGKCKNPIIEAREIFKDPITDDGTKKSKKGLLKVQHYEQDSMDIHVIDQQTWKEEQEGLLETVFKDSKLIKSTTLEEIRERLNNQ